MSRLDALRKMAESRPGDPFVHYGLAMEYRAQGRADDARAAFERLLHDFPDYVPAYVMAGQLYAEMGRADDARAAFRRGIEVAARKGDAHARGEMEQFLASLG